MINYRKISLFTICFIVLTGMTACASEESRVEDTLPIEDQKNVSANELLKDTPSHIEKEFNENYIVNADVSVPEIENADVLFAKYKHIDEKKLVSVFYDGKKPDKEINEEDNTVSYRNENSMLVVADEYISYQTEDYDYIKFPIENFTPEYDSLSAGKKYKEVFLQENLDFMNRKKALETVRRELEKLSLGSIADSVEIYAIDCDTMQREQEKRIQEEISMQKKMGVSPLQDPTDGYRIKKKYTQEDEFYIMYFKMLQNNIPVSQNSYDILSGERSLYGSEVKVLLSRKGIIAFECSGIYGTIGSEETPETFISVEEAVQDAYGIYDSIISTDKVTVRSIDFEYVPVAYNDNYNEVKLIPSWSLQLIYTSGVSKGEEDKKSESDKSIRMLYINALTGEEIK